MAQRAAIESIAPAGLGLRERLRRAAAILRRVIGAPDYDAYTRHVREHHPECEPMSRDEFMQQKLDSKYSQPGNRCC